MTEPDDTNTSRPFTAASTGMASMAAEAEPTTFACNTRVTSAASADDDSYSNSSWSWNAAWFRITASNLGRHTTKPHGEGDTAAERGDPKGSA